jgi:hypothetical protein
MRTDRRLIPIRRRRRVVTLAREAHEHRSCAAQLQARIKFHYWWVMKETIGAKGDDVVATTHTVCTCPGTERQRTSSSAFLLESRCRHNHVNRWAGY